MLSLSVHSQVNLALDAAVGNCVRTQRADGAWESIPDPRITETALTALALGIHAPDAVAKARVWLKSAQPQSHDQTAWAFENALLAMALDKPDVVSLEQSSEANVVLSSRNRLVQVVALCRGRAVRGGAPPEQLRAETEHAVGVTTRLKRWSHVELLSCHVLLECALGDRSKAKAAIPAIVAHQSDSGSFYDNPVTTALAFLALDSAARDTTHWQKTRQYLTSTQQPDGTWRFCSSDVWDTTLTLRSFRGLPEFEASCAEAAVDFLAANQNEDGGWSFRQGVESDNDTASAVMISLAGRRPPGGATLGGLAYLADQQTSDGLWQTWQSRDDPPVEDVVAHVVSALSLYPFDHDVVLAPARRWLVDRWRARGRWTASWYRGLPYATREVSHALGAHPLVDRALDDLVATRNDDGGWPTVAGEPSSPSATGLVMACMANSGAFDPPTWEAAIDYLVGTQQGDGTWPGTPEMFGPRPLLTHFQTHTQAFAALGLRAARCYQTGGRFGARGTK